jgi:hypothetical protein
MEVGQQGQACNRVLEHLLRIPQMRPLGVGWVVLVLGALALLLGPVDYLVLKKLDRLPLTWLTSAGCIVVVTIAAYFGVQALRGGALRLRLVTVRDGIAGTSSARTPPMAIQGRRPARAPSAAKPAVPSAAPASRLVPVTRHGPMPQ